MNYTLYVFASVLIIPMFIFSVYISNKVNSTFKKYEGFISNKGYTAGLIARQVLDKYGLHEVQIKRVSGKLTDHYNPKDNCVYLSDSVYDNRSVSAIGVATHECGHAMQYASNYLPVKIRTAIVPTVNWGSRLAMPILLLGLAMDIFLLNSSLGYYVMIIGVIMYSLTTLFALITLPTELNASKRAKEILADGILTADELDASSEVLRSAAMTYVASLAVSILMLIRVVFMFLGRRK